MPGVITKRILFTHPITIYRIGGFRLFFAVLLARRGVPFLTIFQRYVR